jgi:hypothetical protein
MKSHTCSKDNVHYAYYTAGPLVVCCDTATPNFNLANCEVASEKSGGKVMEEKAERPWATLYIFQRKGKIVAVAIGQAPPVELHCDWDSLTRIPIMKNGARPTWEAYTWRPNSRPAKVGRRG